MGRRADSRDVRGFYGVGIFNGKTPANLGTLWRSAHAFGASFLFTVGRRYQRQCSDTTKAYRHVPLYNYETLDEMYAHLPLDCQLVGVELHETSESLHRFSHPQRCAYLLGAEDHGLSADAIRRCHRVIQLPGRYCLNVSVAGSIVLHHRFASEAA